MLNKTQFDRYARHIILPQVGKAGQKKLLEAKVLIIGAGGLGSPILLYLAAAGVGYLGINDFDKVALSNLHRQIIYDATDLGIYKTEAASARALNLNPEINVVLHKEKLNSKNAAKIISQYDLVIDGSDNFPTRYLVNDTCILEKKPFIYGALSQFEGQVSLFNAPMRNGFLAPCYRCLYPNMVASHVRNCAEEGVLGALAGVIGTIMATESIKFILNLGESLAGKLIYYDALYSQFHEIKLTRNSNCSVCWGKN